MTNTHIQQGLFEHFKGDKYELFDVVENADEAGTLVAVYRNVKTGRRWCRPLSEFLGEVVDKTITEDSDGSMTKYTGPRFKLVTELSKPIQLFVSTLRLNRQTWLQYKDENPLFIGQGGSMQFKFVLCDKIHFAYTIRLITKNQCMKLLEWVKRWDTKYMTSYDRKSEE